MLVQPLTGDDLVKVIAVTAAGITAILYAWRSPATGKTSVPDQLALIHQTMSNVLLAIKPPETTSTTTMVETPEQTTTTTTASKPAAPANQAMTDTLPLGTPSPVGKVVTAPVTVVAPKK